MRCCCSGLCILLAFFNKALLVSLQKDSGQGDALPNVIFAFQTLPLLLLSGDANLVVFYFLHFGPYVTIVYLITTISHSYCTPGKGSQKTYGARENCVLHCTQAYFRDNRLWYTAEKMWALWNLLELKWRLRFAFAQPLLNTRITLKLVFQLLKF